MANLRLPEIVVDCFAGVTDKDGLKLSEIEEIEESVQDSKKTSRIRELSIEFVYSDDWGETLIDYINGGE